MCDVSPPRCAIQRRIGEGYIEYSIWVASRLVIVRPFGPKSQAAWNPSLRTTSRKFCHGETAARMMVQAEAQKPSITTVSPELRRP